MAVNVQTDMATPSLHRHGSHELKQRYLAPGASRGEMVAAIAVTEPDAGSDVAGIRTRAVRDGDEWVINGAKLYITNGTQADWLCLLARTSDEGGYRGMCRSSCPPARPGSRSAGSCNKLGNCARTPRSCPSIDVRVPVAQHHRRDRPRLPAADGAVPERAHDRGLHAPSAPWRRRFDRTADYLQRPAGLRPPLIANQYLQFKLAELAAELDLLRHYNYACAEAYLRGEDTTRSHHRQV